MSIGNPHATDTVTTPRFGAHRIGRTEIPLNGHGGDGDFTGYLGTWRPDTDGAALKRGLQLAVKTPKPVTEPEGDSIASILRRAPRGGFFFCLPRRDPRRSAGPCPPASVRMTIPPSRHTGR